VDVVHAPSRNSIQDVDSSRSGLEVPVAGVKKIQVIVVRSLHHTFLRRFVAKLIGHVRLGKPLDLSVRTTSVLGGKWTYGSLNLRKSAILM
jgi:hypothetical protein